MNELEPKVIAFVREAASAEAEAVLSRARRDEIRRRFAARQSAGARAGSSAPRFVAAIAGVLASGVPLWAMAAIGLAAGVAATVAVVSAHDHARPSHEPHVDARVEARPAESAASSVEPRRTAPDRAAAPEAQGVTSPIAPGAVESTGLESSRAAAPRGSSWAMPARASSSAPSLPAEAGLGAEAALLESVERALRARDSARALALLDEHARRFPAGALLMEAEAARAIATCQTADGEHGRELAAEFARRWPNAPVGARVAAACRAPTIAP